MSHQSEELPEGPGFIIVQLGNVVVFDTVMGEHTPVRLSVAMDASDEDDATARPVAMCWEPESVELDDDEFWSLIKRAEGRWLDRLARRRRVA